MSEEPNSPHGLSTFSGCLVRIFWMGAGNVLMFVLAILIAQKEVLVLTVYDLGLWALAAAMVAVRYIDITRLHGQTTDGEPATLAHWRRYALGLASITLLFSIMAHALAATSFLK